MAAPGQRAGGPRGVFSPRPWVIESAQAGGAGAGGGESGDHGGSRVHAGEGSETTDDECHDKCSQQDNGGTEWDERFGVEWHGNRGLGGLSGRPSRPLEQVT
jgi:hypothetical protein